MWYTIENMLLQRAHAKEAYQSAARRQVFIFLFSMLFGLLVVGGVFFVAYQVIRSGGVRGGENSVSAPLMTPLAQYGSIAEEKQESAEDIFIFGELSSLDNTYRVYKVRVFPFSKEEIFSFPWSDAAVLPEITAHASYLAVFFAPENGIMVDADGKPVPERALAFRPPSAHFTISPDGARMLYFKYFSSLGTAGLFVRDMKKNEDVFAWPVGSPPSRVCEFTGWSPDNTKAYCALTAQLSAETRVYDVKNFSWKTIPAALQGPDDVFSGARPLAFFADGTRVLLEGLASDGAVQYVVSQRDGAKKKELFAVARDIVHSRYIGKFSRK